MDTDVVTVLGIAGSVRKGAYDQVLLRSAQSLTPDALYQAWIWLQAALLALVPAALVGAAIRWDARWLLLALVLFVTSWVIAVVGRRLVLRARRRRARGAARAAHDRRGGRDGPGGAPQVGVARSARRVGFACASIDGHDPDRRFMVWSRMEDVILLEPHTHVDRSGSYVLSYPHLLSYFSARAAFDASDLVRGAHMVYGWMPTIVELHVASADVDLEVGAALLTKAKDAGALTDGEIAVLASLVNHSLVGASKLLHFVAPDRFAIWDSKIYAFVFEQRPHNYRVQQVASYRAYLDVLRQVRSDARFPQFHASVNTKVGYGVSPLRAIELVMFLNSPDVRSGAAGIGGRR